MKFSPTEKLKGTSRHSNTYSSLYCQTKDNIKNKHLPVRVGGTVASCRVVPSATPVIWNVQGSKYSRAFHLHYDNLTTSVSHRDFQPVFYRIISYPWYIKYTYNKDKIKSEGGTTFVCTILKHSIRYDIIK